MIIVTTDTVPGRRILATHGLARGNAVRSRSLPRDIMAFVRGLIGGEIPEYTKMLAEAREQALDRLAEQAQAAGGNAVVGMRFVSAELMGSAAELLAYGTVVTLEE